MTTPPKVRLPVALAIVTVPFVLFLYPFTIALLSHSDVPSVLGRWSWSAASFIAVTTTLFVFFVAALLTRRWTWLALATAFLIALSYIAPASGGVKGAPGMIAMLTALRLIGVVALALIAIFAVRSGFSRTGSVSLVAAALLLVPSMVDLVWSFLPERDEHNVWERYRIVYDMTKLTRQDIAIVGDSYIWGFGVPPEKRIGDVLERKLQAAAPAGAPVQRVYSMGQVGANLKNYVAFLRDVPAKPGARRIVIAFFINDMPPVDRLDRYMEWLAVSAGKSSISARLTLDLLRLSFAPDVDGYSRQLLDDFDEGRPDFPKRWQLLTDLLGELYRSSVERSAEKPVLLLLPALADFERDRWVAIHQRLTRTGESLGYQVLDLLPDMDVGLPGAKALRIWPNDLHFSERGNEIAAQRLFEFLRR